MVPRLRGSIGQCVGSRYKYAYALTGARVRLATDDEFMSDQLNLRV
jgi:hypothetical protein